MKLTRLLFLAALALGGLLSHPAPLRADHAPRAVLPDAVADLRTPGGLALVRGEWRYSDTRIGEIDHRGVGADLKASGPRNRTFDFTPDARAADFDDSEWEVIAPDTLEQRRGHGRLSLNWYRLRVTVPEKIGGFATRGSTIVFEIVVDD
jgi:gluconolactonase